MSRSLAANAGSLHTLKVRARCGRSLWARQIRCTELMLIPTAAAMALAVQWVASCGGSVGVSSTTRSIVAYARGGMGDGRFLSRSRPATPSRTNLSCQRQTQGLDLPVRRTISPVPRPSAVARTILARQTCFCGLFLSATTASRRARSAALISTLIPSRIPATWGREWPTGIFRQTRSTRANRRLAGTLVAAVAEVGRCVLDGDAVERRAERPVQLLRGARRDPTQLGLDLRAGRLERPQGRRVGRQVAVGEAGPVQQLPHGGRLVRAQVVHHEHRVRLGP